MTKRNDFKIVKYEKGEIALDVRYDEENKTIWLTQSEMTYVFKTSKQNINKHIREVLNSASVVNCEFTTDILGKDGKKYQSSIYNLDMIEAIYSKTKSQSGYDFIKWANELINNFNKNKVGEIQPYKAKNYEIVTFYGYDFTLDVNVSLIEETVWLTQNDMALLYGTTIANISMHISNIFNSKELTKSSVIKKSLTTATDGKKYNYTYYNLDVVLAVGYRVNTEKGVMFRKWATKVLRDYSIKGYALNNYRLTNRVESFDYLLNDLNETKSMLIKLANNDELKTKSIESILSRLDKLEDKENVFVGQILYENDFFEGYSFTKKKLASAKSSIILIDDYVDITVLDMFNVVDKNIDIIIYTLPSAELSKQDIDRFNKTYKSKIIKTNKAHYRMLIIDDDIYVYTYSIKDLGKKRSAIIKIDFTDKDSITRSL